MKYTTICRSYGSGAKRQTAEQALVSLDEEVNSWIVDHGWEPLGGVSIAMNQSQGVVAQAMIRKGKDK